MTADLERNPLDDGILYVLINALADSTRQNDFVVIGVGM